MNFKTWEWYNRVCLIKTHRHICDMTYFDHHVTTKAQLQNLTSGQVTEMTYYGFQTVCKCPFRAVLVTSATDSNQTWAN